MSEEGEKQEADDKRPSREGKSSEANGGERRRRSSKHRSSSRDSHDDVLGSSERKSSRSKPERRRSKDDDEGDLGGKRSSNRPSRRKSRDSHEGEEIGGSEKRSSDRPSRRKSRDSHDDELGGSRRGTKPERKKSRDSHDGELGGSSRGAKPSRRKSKDSDGLGGSDRRSSDRPSGRKSRDSDDGALDATAKLSSGHRSRSRDSNDSLANDNESAFAEDQRVKGRSRRQSSGTAVPGAFVEMDGEVNTIIRKRDSVRKGSDASAVRQARESDDRDAKNRARRQIGAEATASSGESFPKDRAAIDREAKNRARRQTKEAKPVSSQEISDKKAKDLARGSVGSGAVRPGASMGARSARQAKSLPSNEGEIVLSPTYNAMQETAPIARVASPSSQSSGREHKVPHDGCVEAITVDDNPAAGKEVEQMRREIEELNQSRAAETAEREAREKERKKRKTRRKRISVAILCALVLLAAGLGAYFALKKDESGETSSKPLGNAGDPTSPPFSGSTDEDDNESSSPSSAVSNAPTVPQLYDPPSEQECLAISRNETIEGQADLDQDQFDMAFDVTTETAGDISRDEVQALLVAIQEKLLPPLAGCPSQTVNRRELAYYKQPMIRGVAQQRRLAIGANRFVIFNAFVTGREEPDVVCTNTRSSSQCHRIVVKVSVILKGPIQLLDIVLLISEQVSETLKEEGQDDGNLKDPLSLGKPFSEVHLINVDNQSATLAPVAKPSEMPSQLPSEAPSDYPTLAPVSGPTPPPSARPTSVPSHTPSLRLSAPPSLSPTRSPVAGPTLSPTLAPSREPSIRPTLPPTNIGIEAPSSNPSSVPSVTPTSSPSIEPSMIPSVEPSTNPSMIPSVALSMKPSKAPSSEPSMSPSKVPSLSPSVKPSLSPTTSRCFVTNTELTVAVGNWFDSGQKASVEAQYGLIGDWCFDAGVTSMVDLFKSRSSFNEDISNWDVSSVTDMSNMFILAGSFNQDISSWDVSSVTSMMSMFNKAYAFNQDLPLWDVSSVTSMRNMFLETSVFNGDVTSWNVSSVTDMHGIFARAASFNRNLCAWGSRLQSNANVYLSFLHTTNCPSTQATPNLSRTPPGPFCHVCT